MTYFQILREEDCKTSFPLENLKLWFSCFQELCEYNSSHARSQWTLLSTMS